MMAQTTEHDDDDEAREYEGAMSRVRDKDATVELLTREGEPAAYELFTNVAREAHRRLLMDAVNRRLGVIGGDLPGFHVFRKYNWRGDEATGKVPRGAVSIANEREYLLTGAELSFEVNAQVWDACGPVERAYIVDELWEQVVARLDPEGHQRMDENGRRLMGKAKPDVTTFSAVVGRRGPVFVEIAALVQAAAASGVVQTAFDFRTFRPTAVPDLPAEPEAEPQPDPETIRKNEIAAAKAKRAAMAKV